MGLSLRVGRPGPLKHTCIRNMVEEKEKIKKHSCNRTRVEKNGHMVHIGHRYTPQVVIILPQCMVQCIVSSRFFDLLNSMIH